MVYTTNNIIYGWSLDTSIHKTKSWASKSFSGNIIGVFLQDNNTRLTVFSCFGETSCDIQSSKTLSLFVGKTEDLKRNTVDSPLGVWLSHWTSVLDKRLSFFSKKFPYCCITRRCVVGGRSVGINTGRPSEWKQCDQPDHVLCCKSLPYSDSCII